MKKLRKGLVWPMVLIFFLISSIQGWGAEERVVTLGNDLNQQQRQQMLDLFGVEEEEVKILVVTNEEERTYLQGIASEEQIGSRAISSAYVEALNPGAGIQVQTYNLTWVTAGMFQNALVTAGVKDAKIIAAAPVNVSGTAALTGIIKAFEALKGQNISQEQKEIANEEIVKTGELGQSVGQERATELIQTIKQEIVEKNIKSPEEIRRIIIEISGNLNINLNERQIEDITRLMEGISRLNLDTDEIRQQLRGITEQLGEIARQNEEVRGLLQRIIDLIKDFFNSLIGMLTGK
ncbi:DUF1002 domain-containing protein [Alkaliphilus crotonatoxidans]